MKKKSNWDWEKERGRGLHSDFHLTFWPMVSHCTPMFIFKVVSGIRWKVEKESKSSVLIQRFGQRSHKIKLASWAMLAEEEGQIAQFNPISFLSPFSYYSFLPFFWSHFDLFLASHPMPVESFLSWVISLSLEYSCQPPSNPWRRRGR